MLINVPQYIDVEDKVAGPVTAKQLMWLVILGVLLLIFWNIFPKPVFFIVGVPTVILFLALAFYKPYGQPLGNFLLFGILYFFKPKIYVWKRTANRISVGPQPIKKANEKINTDQIHKKQVLGNIEGLAKILDSNGAYKDERLVEILKQTNAKTHNK